MNSSPLNRFYDAVIVGSGLTAGWVAKELAEAGLHIAVLEAGPWIDPLKANSSCEYEYAERLTAARRQPIQRQHPDYWTQNPELFVDDVDNPYSSTPDNPFLWIRGRQVGGRSHTWAGVTLRFSDHEFLAPERDGFGLAWPIQYKDLAYFYDKVEGFLRVEGAKDGLPQLPDGRFMPAPPLTRAELDFKRRVESDWPERHVISSRGIPLTCGEYDWTDRNWQPKCNLSNTLSAAVRTGRVTLSPNSIVSHLICNRNTGLPTGVACVNRLTKKAFEVSGRAVVLCASSIESVRILLNSKTSQHPGGVGNSSGKLGQFLVDHMAVCKGGTVPNVGDEHSYLSGGAHGICIPRYQNLAEDSSKFIRGYGMVGGIGRANSASGHPQWHLISQLEVLPKAENRIEIDRNQVDNWGINTVRVSLRYSENEQSMKKDAEDAMDELISCAQLKAGFSVTQRPGQYVHELGGARMGAKSSESVLNSFNQCWDAKNLFVLDGSCFVTAGWQNPTLTMMAIALRGSHFILESLRRNDI